jgi:hypothetical protein
VLSADNPFYRQVVLLIELLPLVARERCFALKGGTAINLFVRDLPRLSVDIDLTYLPIKCPKVIQRSRLSGMIRAIACDTRGHMRRGPV